MGGQMTAWDRVYAAVGERVRLVGPAGELARGELVLRSGGTVWLQRDDGRLSLLLQIVGATAHLEQEDGGERLIDELGEL